MYFIYLLFIYMHLFFLKKLNIYILKYTFKSINHLQNVVLIFVQ